MTPRVERPSGGESLRGHEKRLRALERAEPISTGGLDLADTISASLGLSAFWKLNETSGVVAHDSGPFGYDLAVGGSFAWADPAGPPGDPTILWSGGIAAGGPPAAFTDDFTAMCWIRRDTNAASLILGQGQPLRAGSSTGWSLFVDSDSPGGNLLNLFWRTNAGGPNVIASTAPVPALGWHMVACVRDSGVFRLSVDGVSQADTSALGLAANAAFRLAGDTWPGPGLSRYSGRMSYTALWDRPLSDSELLALYDLAFTGGIVPDYQVLTADGVGGSSWKPPTVLVYREGV